MMNSITVAATIDPTMIVAARITGISASSRRCSSIRVPYQPAPG